MGTVVALREQLEPTRRQKSDQKFRKSLSFNDLRSELEILLPKKQRKSVSCLFDEKQKKTGNCDVKINVPDLSRNLNISCNTNSLRNRNFSCDTELSNAQFSSDANIPLNMNLSCNANLPLNTNFPPVNGNVCGIVDRYGRRVAPRCFRKTPPRIVIIPPDDSNMASSMPDIRVCDQEFHGDFCLGDVPILNNSLPDMEYDPVTFEYSRSQNEYFTESRENLINSQNTLKDSRRNLTDSHQNLTDSHLSLTDSHQSSDTNSTSEHSQSNLTFVISSPTHSNSSSTHFNSSPTHSNSSPTQSNSSPTQSNSSLIYSNSSPTHSNLDFGSDFRKPSVAYSEDSLAISMEGISSSPDSFESCEMGPEISSSSSQPVQVSYVDSVNITVGFEVKKPFMRQSSESNDYSGSTLGGPPPPLYRKSSAFELYGEDNRVIVGEKAMGIKKAASFDQSKMSDDPVRRRKIGVSELNRNQKKVPNKKRSSYNNEPRECENFNVHNIQRKNMIDLSPRDILKNRLKQSMSMHNLFTEKLKQSSTQNYDYYHTVHGHNDLPYFYNRDFPFRNTHESGSYMHRGRSNSCKQFDEGNKQYVEDYNNEGYNQYGKRYKDYKQYDKGYKQYDKRYKKYEKGYKQYYRGNKQHKDFKQYSNYKPKYVENYQIDVDYEQYENSYKQFVKGYKQRSDGCKHDEGYKQSNEDYKQCNKGYKQHDEGYDECFNNPNRNVNPFFEISPRRSNSFDMIHDNLIHDDIHYSSDLCLSGRDSQLSQYLHSQVSPYYRYGSLGANDDVGMLSNSLLESKNKLIVIKCCCGGESCSRVVPIQQYLETYYTGTVSDFATEKKI